jgi:hypothetical protein
MTHEPGPEDAEHGGTDELSAEELDLVAGGFQVAAQPSEQEPFSPGTYNITGAG